MNLYNDKLESLLLAKAYADLTPSEKDFVARAQMDSASYASARSMRMRTRTLLAAESAPVDPAGLAAVLERTRRRRGAVVPLWQMAAAVVLAIMLTWWGKGWADGAGEVVDNRLAVTDTLYKEVKTVDTVFMPAPPPEKIFVVERIEVPAKAQVRLVASNSQPSKEVAAAMAMLPAPEVAERSAGIRPGSDFRPIEVASYSDKLQGVY